MKALILVDIQVDFLPGGALAVPRGDEVVPVANAIQEHFQTIVATQDWHPANHGSFATQHPGKSVGDVIDLHGLTQVLWPVHCVQGEPGAAFSSVLKTDRIQAVFQKGTDPKLDSYSGFFDNAHRKATGLGGFLKQKKVRDVYILGLATDYCVKFTALDSRDLGFSTHIVTDGCRGVDLNRGDVDAALEEMAQAGVILVESGDLPN